MHKLALVHDWFLNTGGAEKVVCEMYNLFNTDIFTLIKVDSVLKELEIPNEKVHALIKIPYARKLYKFFFPFFPFLVEQISLENYDVIISSSHSFVKGVLTKSYQIHICYCHTPPRYIWDLYFLYLKEIPKPFRPIFRLFSHYIRIWDTISAQRVDYFIANSKYVAKRIKKFYGRDSTVIYPPVRVDKFKVVKEKEDFYVTVSRLVPYKNIKFILRAFKKLEKKKLYIIGTGPQLEYLKKIAPPNVTFLGKVDFPTLHYYISHAKAFIFVAEEDFGIAPVEAMACGTPVIAWSRGGVVETVESGKTGLLFSDLSEEELIEKINFLEKHIIRFDPLYIREHAKKFSVENFRRKLLEYLNHVIG